MNGKNAGVFVSALILLLSVFLFSCKSDIPQSLKIMTYNIHRGQDADNNDRLMEMAAFIKESGADIVGLQEVDSVCYRSVRVGIVSYRVKCTIGIVINMSEIISQFKLL